MHVYVCARICTRNGTLACARTPTPTNINTDTNTNTNKHNHINVSSVLVATQPSVQKALEQIPKRHKVAQGIPSWSLKDFSEFERLAERQRKRWHWIDQIESDSFETLQMEAKADSIESRLSVIKNRHGKQALHVAHARVRNVRRH